MSEITNEIRVKIFALYYGCEAIHGSFPNSTFIINGVYRNKPYLGTSDSDTSYKCNPDNCQLLLKPLSSISNEDAIGVGKLLNLQHFNDLGVEEVRQWLNDKWGKSTVKHKWECFAIVDYLRSKGYMLPAYGITDLFEAGIAIDSIKITA